MNKINTLIVALIILATTKPAAAQKVEWVNEATPHNLTNSPFNFKKIIPDGAGNLYAYGTLKAPSNYNGTVLSPISSYAGSSFNNSFIMKLDTAGNALWHKIITGPGSSNNTIKDITVGVNNDLILLAGASNYVIVNADTFLTGSATFQHLAVVFLNNGTYKGLSSAINQPFPFTVEKIFFNNNAIYTIGGQPTNGLGSFIWKHDTTLVQQWQVSTNNGWDEFTDLDFLSDSSIIAIGYDGTAGPSGLTIDTLVHSTSQIGVRNFYTKINHATGHALWVNVIGNATAVGNINSVTIDNTNNIYMAGVLSSNSQLFYFGNDTIGNPSIVSNNGPAYILKADAAGNAIWGKDFYAGAIALDSRADALVLDDLNNAYLFPYITFGSITEPGQQPYFNYTNPGSVCFIKVNSSGNLQYGKSYNNIGAPQTDGRFTSATFVNGNMYITGTWVGNGASQMKLGCHRTEDTGYLIMISNNNEPVPVAGFDMLKQVNKIYLTNTTQGGTAFNWNFDDGNTSTQVNPAHTYINPGVYTVSLTVSDSCGTDSTTQTCIVSGIEKIVPNRLSNTGTHPISIYGGFNYTSGTFKLIKSGSADFIIDSAKFINNKLIVSILKVSAIDIGYWDLVIDHGAISDTLHNAILFETPNNLEPEININGATAARINTYKVFEITVINNSNQTLWGVPVYLGFNKEVGYSQNNVYLDSAHLSVLTLTGAGHINFVSNTSDSIQTGAFCIPFLQPQVPFKLKFTFISSTPQKNFIGALLGEPILNPDSLFFNNSVNRVASSAACKLPLFSECFINILGFFPVVGCVSGAYSLGCSMENFFWKEYDGVGKTNSYHVFDLLLNTVGAAASCAGAGITTALAEKGEFALAIKINQFLGSNVSGNTLVNVNSFLNGAGGATGVVGSGTGCFNLYKNLKDGKIGFWETFLSCDPNSKSSIKGITAENYINKNEELFYTINFENVAAASAPAAVVEIIDTLDLSIIDPATFGFISFGFGDTVFSYLEPGYTFVEDIDIQTMIVRVTAALDTTTGILRVKFHSYDKVTMISLLDSTTGFLPPNINSPEGEGFVTFHCKLKSSATHLDAIHNIANIYFDNNLPIATDTCINTVDTIPPVSNVTVLPLNVSDTLVLVHVNYSDAHAGVRNYEVFVSVNDSAYFSIFNFSSDSAFIYGKPGDKMEFYSIATDHAGNIEDAPLNPETNPDAVTTIVVGLQEINSTTAMQVIPNPANNLVTVTMLSSTKQDYTIEVLDIQGRVLFNQTIKENERSTSLQINTAAFNNGIYYIKVSGTSFKHAQKLAVLH